MNASDVFTLIAEVGAPIAGALIAGIFIFVIIKVASETVVKTFCVG